MGLTPPVGLDEIIATFGDPHAPDFEAKNIVSFDLPYALVFGSAMVSKARAHRLVVPAFVAAFEDIKESNLVDRATHFSGIYAQRPIRGFPKFPSSHSWGIAIDLNAETNALGGKSHQDVGVVEIFKAIGFSWGGEFKSRKDPMHFQFCSGY